MTSCKIRFCLSAASIAAALGAPPASAQWSDDASSPLVVSDLTGGNTQPKIVAAPDGGFYVSWFSDTDGFDVHLQRLDVFGAEVWTHDGIVVADRSYDFTYDYGLAVDADGNAYVAYNCCENGSADEHIAVAKITPDGTPAWGDAGVTVSLPGESVYNAYVTATDDGDVVVAWSADAGVRAQKLDADGAPLWVAGGIELIRPTAALKLLGDVEPAGGGDVIVSWSNQSGSTRILYAQKLASADGSVRWGDDAVRVFGQGNLQAGYYPPFVIDGAGGAVFWDYDYVGGHYVPRVQHVGTDGTLLLGANGVVATTDTTADHVNTSATYDASSGDIYAVWIDTYTSADFQQYDGVSAQRIDASGQLAWGDAGKVLVAPANATDGTDAISQPLALPAPGGFLASWVAGALPAADQPLIVAGLGADGSYLWPAQTVPLKTSGATSRTVGTIGAAGYPAYAWQDGDDAAGLSTIAAQNLNFDGTLGNEVHDTIFADGFDGS
ncbi:MAG TPA: hypothetical protein VGC30_01045 [Dokdonella sp.]